jgi:ubiquinone/menaquinone biosynthesis C-methylase UbiE
MNTLTIPTEELKKTINVRYAEEANKSCCLSCGSALDKANVKAGECFVDLGSGKGMDVLKASRLVGSSGKAIGIDFTNEMIQVAESNRKKLKLENVKFIESSIDSIPLESSTVDVIISNCTINHAKDKTAVYKEIYRLLKTGGRFIVSDVLAQSKLPDEVINNPEAWAGCYGGAIPKEDYYRSIMDSGFNEIEILEESKPYEKGGVIVISITIQSFK